MSAQQWRKPRTALQKPASIQHGPRKRAREMLKEAAEREGKSTRLSLPTIGVLFRLGWSKIEGTG